MEFNDDHCDEKYSLPMPPLIPLLRIKNEPENENLPHIEFMNVEYASGSLIKLEPTTEENMSLDIARSSFHVNKTVKSEPNSLEDSANEHSYYASKRTSYKCATLSPDQLEAPINIDKGEDIDSDKESEDMYVKADDLALTSELFIKEEVLELGKISSKRRQISKVTDHFDIRNTLDKNYKIGVCKLCQAENLVIKMKFSNTTGLHRHLKAKHRGEYTKLYPGKTFKSPEKTKTSNFKELLIPKKIQPVITYDLAVSKTSKTENKDHANQDIQDKLIRFVVKKYLPFNFFEDGTCAELFAAIKNQSCDLKIPSSHQLQERINRKFKDKQAQLKNVLINNSSNVSITIDSWISISNQSYCGLICHYIDKEWNLRSFVLDIQSMHGKHTGEELARIIFDVVKFYNIETKIQGITTDGTASNFTFARHLEALLNSEGFDSRSNYCPCFAHILNLSVQEFMKLIKAEQFPENSVDDSDSDNDDSYQGNNSYESPVVKIRIICKKITRFKNTQIKFHSCCTRFDLVPSRPVMDVKTRWNSTCEMLSWAVKYKLPLNLLCDKIIELLQFKLSQDEWSLIEIVIKYMQPFKTLYNMLTAEKYCAISMAVLGINVLLDKLGKWAFELDTVGKSTTDDQIIHALIAARDTIVKHYKNTHWMYCIALILDPRHKKEAFNLTKWGRELEGHAITKFEDVLKNQYFERNQSSETKGNTDISSSEFNINFNGILLQNDGSSISGASESKELWKSEINKFFAYKRVNEDVDILLWWKVHEEAFPILSKMARDFFCVMATSVPSEKLFSNQALFLRKHRNGMNSESIRNLLCLNSWESF